MQDFGEGGGGGGGGVRHEELMKGRGAREALENFCAADCTLKEAGDWKLRQSTPMNERHSV